MASTESESVEPESDKEPRAAIKELRNRLGLAFQSAQEEAYASWCAWEASGETAGAVAHTGRGRQAAAAAMRWASYVRTWLSRRAWIPRLAWAGIAVMVAVSFAVGLVARPVLLGVPPRVPSGAYVLAKPPSLEAVPGPGLGIGPAVNPEAVRYFKEAMALYAEPDFAERAIPKLRQAVAVDPRFEQAQFWLGIALLLKGDAAAALPHLEEARRLAPGRTEYTEYLVWAYLRNGLVDKALSLQTELLKRR